MVLLFLIIFYKWILPRGGGTALWGTAKMHTVAFCLFLHFFPTFLNCTSSVNILLSVAELHRPTLWIAKVYMSSYI